MSCCKTKTGVLIATLLVGTLAGLPTFAAKVTKPASGKSTIFQKPVTSTSGHSTVSHQMLTPQDPHQLAAEVAAPVSTTVSGQVLTLQGRPAAGVKVLFERINNVYSIPLNTDSQGRYTVKLNNGEWLGYACDSPQGYSPLFWQVAIHDDLITSFNELQVMAPQINSMIVYHQLLMPNAQTNQLTHIPNGTTVTLTGKWFGCSGKVLLEIEGRQLEITTFTTRNNTRVEFTLPNLADLGLASATSFSLSYIRGSSRSASKNWSLPQPSAMAAGLSDLPLPGSNPESATNNDTKKDKTTVPQTSMTSGSKTTKPAKKGTLKK